MSIRSSTGDGLPAQSPTGHLAVVFQPESRIDDASVGLVLFGGFGISLDEQRVDKMEQPSRNPCLAVSLRDPRHPTFRHHQVGRYQGSTTARLKEILRKNKVIIKTDRSFLIVSCCADSAVKR